MTHTTEKKCCKKCADYDFVENKACLNSDCECHTEKAHTTEFWEEEGTHTVRVYSRKEVEDLLASQEEKAAIECAAHEEAARKGERIAFGACTNCYGKGYATVRETAGTSRGVWLLDPIRPCSCKRGKQIRAMRKNDHSSLKEKIEGRTVKLEEYWGTERLKASGYNQALSDVLSLLKED